jgi:hypothetical protein
VIFAIIRHVYALNHPHRSKCLDERPVQVVRSVPPDVCHTVSLTRLLGDAVYNCVAVSDEDEEAAEGDAEQDDEDEDEDVSEGEVADTSLPPPRIFRPSALSRNSQSQSQSQSQAPSVPFSQSQKEEGSTTGTVPLPTRRCAN